jgi:hypothetical protein
LPFKKWGKLFHNAAAASAIADHLVHKGLLIGIQRRSHLWNGVVQASFQFGSHRLDYCLLPFAHRLAQHREPPPSGLSADVREARKPVQFAIISLSDSFIPFNSPVLTGALSFRTARDRSPDGVRDAGVAKDNGEVLVLTALAKSRIVRSVEVGKVSKKAAILGGIMVLSVVLAIVALSGGKQPRVPSPPPPLPPPPIEPVRVPYHRHDASPPPVRLARPEQPSKPQGKSITKDEVSLMAKLRDLGSSDLELSLKLAREGNERYPDSPDAVERTWFVCKSLTGLGRSEEARAEALKMVEKYPGTSFTNDVQRHVLFAPQFEPPGQ